jgi:hypothetical protein
MTQQLLPIAAVAQHFHRAEFSTLRCMLAGLRHDATHGRLGRQEQLTLLELAEYGLFYTSFYDTILRRMRSGELQLNG